MRVSELSGEDLNRAVAMALGMQVYLIQDRQAWAKDRTSVAMKWVTSSTGAKPTWMQALAIPNFVSSWVHTGPLIEQFQVALSWSDMFDNWRAVIERQPEDQFVDEDGATALEAICRAVVAIQYGEEIDMGEQLICLPSNSK